MRTPPRVMLRVSQAGVLSKEVEIVGCCAMMVFTYIFQCKSDTVSYVLSDQVDVVNAGQFTPVKNKFRYLRKLGDAAELSAELVEIAERRWDLLKDILRSPTGLKG